MNAERIKEIQKATAYPESVSVMQALLQVWHECDAEHKTALAEERAKMPSEELQRLMDSIRQWSDNQFGEGQRNPAIAYHLLKEVPELIEAFERYQKSCAGGNYDRITSEYADCFMLLLDSASHFGLNADKLIEFAHKKLEINKRRQWGEPDKNGVVEHVRNRIEGGE
ncbi:MAG: dATP/dGTP pyrophosphohydrolase domain-containing protein [Candidatus Pacearchaeota archaeon]